MDVGSIHSDTWTGLAADLALSNYIGEYTVVGWWKERSHLDKWNEKVRYSLVVSIETLGTDIDLLTSIKNEIKAKAKVETEIEF